jgi:hypothetical protein
MPNEILRQSDVSVLRHPITGAYVCSAIVSGHRVQRVYYGYTKRLAVRQFVAEVRAHA